MRWLPPATRMPTAPQTTRAEARRIWMAPPALPYVAERSGAHRGDLHAAAQSAGLRRSCRQLRLHDAPGRARTRVLARPCARTRWPAARERGYTAMQFNFVVASNEGAVRLWQQHGFAIVGRVPGRVPASHAGSGRRAHHAPPAVRTARGRTDQRPRRSVPPRIRPDCRPGSAAVAARDCRRRCPPRLPPPRCRPGCRRRCRRRCHRGCRRHCRRDCDPRLPRPPRWPACSCGRPARGARRRRCRRRRAIAVDIIDGLVAVLVVRARRRRRCR